ncbi:MAG: efflux transporter outer membrane subunit [Proteobacteria bacterium]|nr:efflux transporter outer membrane subunit [Pseudomonadota bacterium]
MNSRTARYPSLGTAALSPGAAALAATLLTACSLAPHYRRPQTEAAPPQFKEAQDLAWKTAAPADETPRGRWWEQFGDPDLDRLEEQVGASNQGLKAAFARLEQARAQTRSARASWFPDLSAQASATRGEASLNSAVYNPGRPATGNTFTTGAAVSWELDVFGRVRNTVAAAHASEQASAGDLAALDLATHAQLATTYFTLRGLDEEQALLDRTVGDYEHALTLTRNLYQGGAAALADVQQAQLQVDNARTQAEDVRLRRAQDEHAISVLIGRLPSTFTLPPRTAAQAPGELPAPRPQMPSQLLERRPDVAAAERRVAAANAAIGVARAAWFPLFSLQGAAGYESTQSSNWITAPSRFWSLGPTALLTVFDWGRHAAQSAAARAAYEEQVANYRGTVLTAYQEVEDSLAALRQLQREATTQAAAVAAAQGALHQATLRYQGGIVTYLEVVSTENAALSAQLAAAEIRTRQANATVLLLQALGGDWRDTGS